MDEFDALFDSFRATVYRLETLPVYNVGGDEADRIAAFLDGRARPEVSIRSSPWLARIARGTLYGKRWSRTRVVDDPLTDYQRYQLESYREGQAVGTETRVVRRADLSDDGPDFWLFDAGLPTEHAVLMHYDADGRWLGADPVVEASELATLRNRQAAADAVSVPFNEFLAQVRGG